MPSPDQGCPSGQVSVHCNREGRNIEAGYRKAENDPPGWGCDFNCIVQAIKDFVVAVNQHNNGLHDDHTSLYKSNACEHQLLQEGSVQLEVALPLSPSPLPPFVSPELIILLMAMVEKCEEARAVDYTNQHLEEHRSHFRTSDEKESACSFKDLEFIKWGLFDAAIKAEVTAKSCVQHSRLWTWIWKQNQLSIPTSNFHRNLLLSMVQLSPQCKEHRPQLTCGEEYDHNDGPVGENTIIGSSECLRHHPNALKALVSIYQQLAQRIRSRNHESWFSRPLLSQMDWLIGTTNALMTSSPKLAHHLVLCGFIPTFVDVVQNNAVVSCIPGACATDACQRDERPTADETPARQDHLSCLRRRLRILKIITHLADFAPRALLSERMASAKLADVACKIALSHCPGNFEPRHVSNSGETGHLKGSEAQRARKDDQKVVLEVLGHACHALQRLLLLELKLSGVHNLPMRWTGASGPWNSNRMATFCTFLQVHRSNLPDHIVQLIDCLGERIKLSACGVSSPIAFGTADTEASVMLSDSSSELQQLETDWEFLLLETLKATMSLATQLLHSGYAYQQSSRDAVLKANLDLHRYVPHMGRLLDLMSLPSMPPSFRATAFLYMSSMLKLDLFPTTVADSGLTLSEASLHLARLCQESVAVSARVNNGQPECADLLMIASECFQCLLQTMTNDNLDDPHLQPVASPQQLQKQSVLTCIHDPWNGFVMEQFVLGCIHNSKLIESPVLRLFGQLLRAIPWHASKGISLLPRQLQTNQLPASSGGPTAISAHMPRVGWISRILSPSFLSRLLSLFHSLHLSASTVSNLACYTESGLLNVLHTANICGELIARTVLLPDHMMLMRSLVPLFRSQVNAFRVLRERQSGTSPPDTEPAEHPHVLPNTPCPSLIASSYDDFSSHSFERATLHQFLYAVELGCPALLGQTEEAVSVFIRLVHDPVSLVSDSDMKSLESLSVPSKGKRRDRVPHARKSTRKRKRRKRVEQC